MIDSYKSLMEIRMERIYNMDAMDVNEVVSAVNLVKKSAQALPERCRVIFEMYFYLIYRLGWMDEFIQRMFGKGGIWEV